MEIRIPELSFILLMGPTSSGKTRFAHTHFKDTEVISSDKCRALVSDDENSMEATADAFDLLHFLAAKRLKRGKLAVIDATNIRPSSRKTLIKLAKDYHFFPVLIGFNVPGSTLKQRHKGRDDRDFSPKVISNQYQDFRRSLKQIKREGIRYRFILEPDDIQNVKIILEPLFNNNKHERPPFDVIGDIHGCYTELIELLEKLGYIVEFTLHGDIKGISHPDGRRVIFLGDLVDRGLSSFPVLRLVMWMANNGIAFCVPGNHDIKLQKSLKGHRVKTDYGLAETLEELKGMDTSVKDAISEFIGNLVSHGVFDGGNLVVAHAGLREDMQGRGSAAVRSFCLFGETTGEIDDYGLPVRYNWASEYKGKAMVVYGHTPVPEPEWLNNTINIDTGCVFGGKLTALRYPEKELVSVSAKRVYYKSIKPMVEVKPLLSLQQEHDDLLDLPDVSGKIIVHTRYKKKVLVQEENSIAALEVMTRYAVNPKWLIYLPPTMSPPDTSDLDEYLEHPNEALEYYKKQRVQKVICEEKHMGSRIIIIVCKGADVSRTRFGILGDEIGICYTRTGRRFFDEKELEKLFLERIRAALVSVDFWGKFETDWVCLDCELMPWSLKAKDLIIDQYAATGTTGDYSLSDIIVLFKKARARGLDIDKIERDFLNKHDNIKKYISAYHQYCTSVKGLNGIKLAPFHIMATEGEVHTNKTHIWHMEHIGQIVKSDPDLFKDTPYRITDLDDEGSIRDTIRWWAELTEAGGEGMVIKPIEYVTLNKGSIIQPGIKCRGREYLRIIYGPDYTDPNNLKRLKKRFLRKKRKLAINEFVLGMEALERFIEKRPLRRIHECVFAVLAMESEAVDPRL